MRSPANPMIYEIHTAAYLQELAGSGQPTVTLDAVPDSELDRLAALGVNTVWMMGVWQRSAAAVAIDAADSQLQDEFRRVLPDYVPRDAIGSAYAVQNYTVDTRFGGDDALARLRERLARRGIGLMLDFVPNHTAPDHAWAQEHIDYYVHTDASAAQNDPASFMPSGDSSIAKGRDPNSAPWPDTLQVNAFAPGYRQATIETLRHIATMCDSVRCDMAMLMLDDVVLRTWSELAGSPLPVAYWRQTIAAVREQQPDVTFVAECYWDTERTLIEHGFDYCYDKTLYDYLVTNDPVGARDYLARTADIQSHMVHFIENHDEPRAAAILPHNQSLAAGAIAAYLPGASLVHAGQIEGKKVKIPVQLGRGPIEKVDYEVAAFYDQLFENLVRTDARSGMWSLINTEESNVIAYEWKQGDTHHMMMVNYSADQLMVPLVWGVAEPQASCYDRLSGETLQPDYDNALQVQLGPWQVRQLTTKPSTY